VNVEQQLNVAQIFNLPGGTGHWPVAAGYQPAATFGGKSPPKTGW
jgi:hypothetical protein